MGRDSRAMQLYLLLVRHINHAASMVTRLDGRYSFSIAQEDFGERLWLGSLSSLMRSDGIII